MRQALLEVVGILGELDRLVGLELDEFERPGADRLGAHVARRDVAGINRRVAGGEQRQQRRLRPLQFEGRFVIAVDGHVVDLVVPGLSRVLPELLLRLAHQHVEGAFDVGRGERLAVMPFDALAQLEGQLLVVGAPGPALGEIRHDRIDAVLRHVLLEHDEIVENRHEGNVDRIGRALVDRGAARAVAVIHPENAALFRLARRRCKVASRQQQQCCRGKRMNAPHGPLHSFIRSRLADCAGRYHGSRLGQPGKPMQCWQFGLDESPRGGTCGGHVAVRLWSTAVPVQWVAATIPLPGVVERSIASRCNRRHCERSEAIQSGTAEA